jgi:hypothetical protein
MIWNSTMFCDVTEQGGFASLLEIYGILGIANLNASHESRRDFREGKLLYSDPIWIVRKDSAGILSHKVSQSHN